MLSWQLRPTDVTNTDRNHTMMEGEVFLLLYTGWGLWWLRVAFANDIHEGPLSLHHCGSILASFLGSLHRLQVLSLIPRFSLPFACGGVVYVTTGMPWCLSNTDFHTSFCVLSIGFTTRLKLHRWFASLKPIQF